MNRRRFLGAMAGGALAVAAHGARSASEERPRRPNVIYAFSDEHRWQSMSFTEMSGLVTPAMARMAAEGVSFTNCISNYPVCSPHRAILMSGQWPYQQGVIDNNIALQPTPDSLGNVFKRAGYRTGYIGKWHLGGTRAEPFGFDTSLIWSNTNTHWDESSYHPKDGDPVTPKGYNATLMTDQAEDFIRANQDEPFFLMVSWNPPHAKFTDAPEEKEALYSEDSLRRRPNVQLDNASADADIWDRNGWGSYRGYHAHVSAIDDELARLIALVDELGIGEDTIIIYSSDHGSMLGSHGVGSKRQPYEESIRVPFIVRWKGHVPEGKRTDALLGAIDVFPTLCALAGLDVPESCPGRDFAPHLLGGGGPEPESQFIMHISKENASGGENHPAPLFRGVRTARYTYAVNPDRPWCLFDNQADPYQMNNLIDAPDLKDLRAELHAMLAKHMAEAEDPMKLPVAM